jgi:hypothetical protein
MYFIMYSPNVLTVYSRCTVPLADLYKWCEKLARKFLTWRLAVIRQSQG